MTAHEYLTRPETLRREIRRKAERIDALRRLSARFTAQPREVRVRSSPDPFRMQALLAEAADEERKIRILEAERRQALTDTALYISCLADVRLIRLLELRYLDGCRWEEAAGVLGYCRSRIFFLHRQALALLPPPPEPPESNSG